MNNDYEDVVTIPSAPSDANIAYEVDSYKELYDYACSVVRSDRPNSDKCWFMERVICWVEPLWTLAFDESFSKVKIFNRADQSVGEHTFIELVNDFMSDGMKSLVDKNHSPEQLNFMNMIGQMMSYRNLYWTIKEEASSLCEDDVFVLIELLICTMCPSVTMILDEGTVEVFQCSELWLMAGDFSDLLKCVLGPEFYELVEGEKGFTTDDVLGVMEQYFESSGGCEVFMIRN